MEFLFSTGPTPSSLKVIRNKLERGFNKPNKYSYFWTLFLSKSWPWPNPSAEARNSCPIYPFQPWAGGENGYEKGRR